MSEVINFRTEKKVKKEAQAIAKKMGLKLSDVLNVFLHHFVRTGGNMDISSEESPNLKLAVFVPLSYADTVRQALGTAGAGKIGNYDFCSFSTRGVGRYRGNEKSNPAIGKAGNLESVEEEKIEVVVPRAILNEVIAKMKKVHPYEEVAFDVYPLEN